MNSSNLAFQARDLVRQSVDWFSQNSLNILLAIAVGATIAAILVGIRKFGVSLCRDADWPSVRAIFGRALGATRNWFVAATAIELVARFGEAPDAVANVSQAMFTIASTLQGALWLREIVLGWVGHKADERQGSGFASAVGIIEMLVSIALFSFATLFILDNLGINVTALVAGLGIGGIAIGLAAQGIFKDLFAALSILFDRPFRRGDQIEFGSLGGRVEAIGLKTTRLRSIGGEQIVVSNARLLDQDIRNLSKMVAQRSTLKLCLSYANSPGLLSSLSSELERAVSTVEGARFGHGVISALGADAIEVELRFHVEGHDRDTMRQVRHRVALAVLSRLDAAGIAFQYPDPPEGRDAEAPVEDAVRETEPA